MPGIDGLGFLDSYRSSGGSAPVIVMTAYGGVDLAVEAVRRGAADFLAKPFGSAELLLCLRKVEEREKLKEEVGRLRAEVRAERRYDEIVARSPGMIQLLETARRVARHTTSVLIVGPTGTGKELLARLIHQESGRASAGFLPVNCGAIPDGLIESEFFGYVKGAFSGAEKNREGLFEAAHGGTLCLDEIGDLPEQLQVKLLRVLQEGEVRRLGETESRKVDVRVIAATNRDLEADVEAGRFRSDLYYRIAIVTLALPPLAERPEDLPHLVMHLLTLQAERLGVPAPVVEPRAMEALLEYPWPGNIRELENVLERALILLSGPRIRREDLGLPNASSVAGVSGGGGVGGSTGGPETDLSVKRRGTQLERELIREALVRTGGHRGKAAQLLELSERALRYKIIEYELE
jgi:two-component system response regulator AtoC